MKPYINIPWGIGIIIYALYLYIDLSSFNQSEFTQKILGTYVFLGLPFFLTLIATYLSKNYPLFWGSSYAIIFPGMWATKHLVLYIYKYPVDMPNMQGAIPIYLITFTYFVIPIIAGSVLGFCVLNKNPK